MKHPTRTLKELYTILLDSYVEKVLNEAKLIECERGRRRYSYFLCNHIGELADDNIITAHEKIVLLNDFQSQRPTKVLHKEFYDNPKFYKLHLSVSWWKYMAYSKKGMEEKIKFLKHLVSIQIE